jgi:hypothetical protein
MWYLQNYSLSYFSAPHSYFFFVTVVDVVLLLSWNLCVAREMKISVDNTKTYTRTYTKRIWKKEHFKMWDSTKCEDVKSLKFNLKLAILVETFFEWLLANIHEHKINNFVRIQSKNPNRMSSYKFKISFILRIYLTFRSIAANKMQQQIHLK